MLRNRFFLGLCPAFLAVFVALGCFAQSSPAASTAAKSIDSKTTRNIELTLRSRLNIPPDYVVQVGPRTASDTPGFDSLLITFELPQHPERSQKLTFLISNDNKTLERISRWDISVDPAARVSAGDRPVRGNPNAKVVLVNFDDLECPFCAKLHSELFPNTLSHYQGLIKIVYRDMPLEELHPWAMHAAVDANCLAAQSGEAYWTYVDYLHTHGEDITGPDRDPKKSAAMLDKVAQDQAAKDKLDTTKIGACLSKQDEGVVRNEMKLADSLEIDQTPTMYINGEALEGAVPEDVLWRAIDRALVSQGVTPPPNPYDSPAKPTGAAAAQTPAKP